MINPSINTKKLYSLTMLFAYMANGLYAINYSSAIPVAFDVNTNEWSVLLKLKAGGSFWTDFFGTRGAQEILAFDTNGKYNKHNALIKGMPSINLQEGSDTYFIHFVLVNYIAGKTLYLNRNTDTIDDFMWIYANELMETKASNKSYGKNQHKIQLTFLKNFKKAWPKVARELEQYKGGAPTPSAKPSAKDEPWKSYNQKADSWSNQNFPNGIYFYDKKKKYYEFTNFYQPQPPIIIDGREWKTSEHYYQAMKFDDSQLRENIRNAVASRGAFDIAQKNKKKVRSDWTKVSLNFMHIAVKAKFSQNSNLKELLLKTGNKVIVEDAGKNDAFFGAGGDYKGQNYLGRILMKVRQKLQKAQASQQPQTKKQPQKPVFQKKPQLAPVQKEWWFTSAWRRLKNIISNALSYFWK